ncbi:MAG TPA: SBBP repeat-containing protein, partial [Blastocatellia bacterium]
MFYNPAKDQKPVKRRSALSAKTLSRAVILMLLVSGQVILSTRLMQPSLASAPATASRATPILGQAEIADRYGKLPLSFESNEGQTDRVARFISRGPGYDLFLTATSAVLTLRKPRPLATTEQETSNQPPESSVLHLKMIGSNPKPRIEGKEQLPGKVNYLIGDDPKKWRANIPTYGKVYYTEVYPKVDLVYYGNRTELEFDFIVAPGGNVQAIKFQVDGTDRLTLDDEGNLCLAVKQSEVILHKPVIYQLTGKGDRREVKGEYAIKGKEVRFKTGAFDASKPLIIDPVLSYSTLLGSGGSESALGIAVDSSGSAYITGSANSSVFPTTPGAFQTSSSSLGGAFVTKLNPTGTSLVYSTYISGSSGSSGTAIAVDASGNACITGSTSSTDYPTVNPLKTKRALFETTDGAASWNNNNDLNNDVSALAVAPNAPLTIYAGTTAGPHKSTDGGATWQKPQNAGLPTFPLSTVLAVDPANPSIVYTGIINGGLYKTTNGGTSWSSVALPFSSAVVFSIAFDPSTPSTIYAGSGNGLFKSTDNGNTWTPLNNFGIPGTPNVRSLAIDPTNTATLYAGTFSSGAFKTTNGGTSWAAILSGQGGSINTIAIDPLSPLTLYAGSSGSINKSTNGGSSWSAANPGVPANFQINALIIDRTNPQAVYAATAGGGVFKTTNGGNSWAGASAGLWKGNVVALATDPTNSATLYAGTSTTFNDDDAIISVLNASGSALLFSTYLGGMREEIGLGITL